MADLSDLAQLSVRLHQLHEAHDRLTRQLSRDGASRQLLQINGQIGAIRADIRQCQRAYSRMAAELSERDCNEM